ncbi:MAG: hypothetical protein ABJK37_22665 [Paraglaciecola sp.]
MSRKKPPLLKSFFYLSWWTHDMAGNGVDVALKFVLANLCLQKARAC